MLFETSINCGIVRTYCQIQIVQYWAKHSGKIIKSIKYLKDLHLRFGKIWYSELDLHNTYEGEFQNT